MPESRSAGTKNFDLAAIGNYKLYDSKIEKAYRVPESRSFSKGCHPKSKHMRS